MSPAVLEKTALKGALEALLFITDRPLKLQELGEVLETPPESLQEALEELKKDYESHSGMRILQVAEGYQMGTRPEHGAFVRRLFKDRTSFRLSQAALETLAIIAYRQPITRGEIEEIRGVDVVAPLETLLERRLVKVTGRKEALGRPLLYGTTMEFLRQFGLNSLEQLPPLETFAPAADAAPAAEAPAAPEAEPAAEVPAPEREYASSGEADEAPAAEEPESSEPSQPPAPDEEPRA